MAIATPDEVRSIELLAPARDASVGIAAINHGADCVYIGGPGFGAREAAANSIGDIARLVAHAHRFRAKVYVAMNTLLNDDEMERAVAQAHELHGIGVDALIIQDMGLVEADLPPIALHGSTQLDNRSVEKNLFYEQIGLQQVVLARELDLEQIRRIREVTTLRLEFFVHGALCVCFSGRCYLSEAMAGRSANRGQCAQYCRHRYDLRETGGRLLVQDRYLLSLKDLDLSHYLAALIDAGIDAFKIEGRLKNVNYVKNITAYYRLALDEILDTRGSIAAASDGRCFFDFTPDPQRVFHRGKTSYFLTGEPDDPAEIRTPKSLGRKIGTVAEASRTSLRIKTEPGIQLAHGDGLCFFADNGELVGLRVNRVEGSAVHIRGDRVVSPGTVMYRNSDAAFTRILAGSERCRRLRADLFLFTENDQLVLEIVDESGQASRTEHHCIAERAKKPGRVVDLAIKQLRKTGESMFAIGRIKVALDPDLYLPVALLNRLRRDGFEHHLQTRLANCRVVARERQDRGAAWPIDAVDGGIVCTNVYAERFYRRHGMTKEEIHPATKPPLMTSRYCLREQLNMCPRHRNTTGDGADLILADGAAGYRLQFDCRKCVMTLYRLHDGKDPDTWQ